jgi:hypothetical protein
MEIVLLFYGKISSVVRTISRTHWKCTFTFNFIMAAQDLQDREELELEELATCVGRLKTS